MELILFFAGIIIVIYAQSRIASTYKETKEITNQKQVSGQEVARKILDANGLEDIYVVEVRGELTDHYDPSRNVIRLSHTVFQDDSIASLAVAAHECGHAIQHQTGYFPLTLRGNLVPVANFGSTMAWPLIIIGLFFNSSTGSFLIQLGIIFFSLAVLFQLVTLPVEFNASNRALHILGTTNMLQDDELKYTRRVLRAAALTYVASAAAAILQLLRLIILFGGNDRD